MKVYIISEKHNVNASAVYDPETKQCTVLEGSRVSSVISDAPSFKGGKAIKRAREKYVVDNVVVEDVPFTSSSTAGNFVMGRSTDGLRTWKNEKGATLKECLEE